MTIEEILEFNKRCAKFLGGEYIRNEEITFEPKGRWHIKKFPDVLQDYNLKFHTDWNWIHEVIEKIRYIEDNQEEFFDKGYFKIEFIIDLLSGVDFKIDNKRIFLQTAFGENQLKEAVVEAINKFLIWYEKQNN